MQGWLGQSGYETLFLNSFNNESKQQNGKNGKNGKNNFNFFLPSLLRYANARLGWYGS